MRPLQDILRHVLPNWHTDERGRRKLEQLVERIKRAGQGQDFDCIIGMSGGVDSSYLTYLAAQNSACGRWSFMSMPAGIPRRR